MASTRPARSIPSVSPTNLLNNNNHGAMCSTTIKTTKAVGSRASARRAPSVRAPPNGLLPIPSHDDAAVDATAATADDRTHSSSHGELLRAQMTVRRLESQARTMALELSQLRVRNEMLLTERDQYRRRSRAGEERLAALQSEMGEIKDEREYVRAAAALENRCSAQRDLSGGTGKGGRVRSLFGGPRPPGRVCSPANLDRLTRSSDVVVSASDAPLRRTPSRGSLSLLGGSSSRSLRMSEIREGHQYASTGHAAAKPGGGNTSNATWDTDPATTTTQATDQARTTTPPQLKAKKRCNQWMNLSSSSAGGGGTATTGSSRSSQQQGGLVCSNSSFFRGSNNSNNNDRDGGGQQSNQTAHPERQGSAAGAVASALWSNITGTPAAAEHAAEADISQQASIFRKESKQSGASDSVIGYDQSSDGREEQQRMHNTAPNSGAAVPGPPTGSSGGNRQRETMTRRRRSTIPVRGNADHREAEERRAKEDFAAWQKEEARRCSYLGWGDAGGAADDQSLASLACSSWDADVGDDEDHHRSISTIDPVDEDLRGAEELERFRSGDRRNQDTIDEQMRRAVQEMHASLSTVQDGGGEECQKKKASIQDSSRNYQEEAHCGFLSWEETKLVRSGSASSTIHDHISPQWSGGQQAEDDGGRNCHHDNNSCSSTPTLNNLHAARRASNCRLGPEETPAQDGEHEHSVFGGGGTHGGDTQKDVESFLARMQSSLHLDVFEQDNKKKSTPTAADDSIPTNIVPIRSKVAPRSSRQNNKKKSREGITFR